jgi:YD repeat-containing protein
MQVARGSVISDTDGSRQGTILFPQGMTATMVLSDGTTSPLTTLNVRATEYTVGANGPNAMPGELPPSSGYTYAVELSVDEAMAADAQEVRFSAPVPFYVENFVGFPVGSLVPTGFYDRNQGLWVASDNGRVIQLISISAGLADLDLDGNGIADDAAAQVELGISDAERQRLAALYAPGQELWRVLLPHFSPWDCNWPFGPPPDSQPPGGSGDPKPGPQSDEPQDDPNQECHSIIGCEFQTLGEVLDVTGTPLRLHYQSDRVPGRRDTNILKIRLSGATLPPSLQRIHLEIAVAGQVFKQDFAPQPNLIDTFTWDGRDAYGRPVQGTQPVKVRIGYEYIAQYYATQDTFNASFNRFGLPPIAVGAGGGGGGGGGAVVFSLPPARTTTPPIILWQDYATLLGRLDSLGLGGWSLSVHHTYDVVGRTLYLGNGDQRSATTVGAVINTVAGTGVGGSAGDGGPATQAALNQPHGVAVGSDGGLYIADFNSHNLRRVGPDGIITTVAGTGVAGFAGDGGPATLAQMIEPSGVAVGSDGSLYIADIWNYRIRRVGPDGIITTVAGTGIAGFTGDGGLATLAQLNRPYGVAVGSDGSLYIADWSNYRIRRVGPDGIITTAVGLSYPPRGVAVGSDGSLYIAESSVYLNPGNRVRRVGSDGVITTLAGTGDFGFAGDGGLATQALLAIPQGLAVGPDGSLYIADSYNLRIRHVASPLPATGITDIPIPSEDGSELYVFNSDGRHLKTLDILTGALRFQFGYDGDGYLVSITDGDGNVTTIERAGATPTAIVAPGGQRTALGVNGDGWLSSVANPASETHTMGYSTEGLLQQFIDPRANVHSFTYDVLGRLIKDEDSVGGSITLARTEDSSSYTVTTTSALGHNNAYRVEELSTGALRRTVTQPSGARTVTMINTDGSQEITYADGTIVTTLYTPDPRWGMLAPLASSVTKTPSGLTRTLTTQRSVTLSDPTDLLSMTRMTETITDNGSVSTLVYDALARLFTLTTAVGRSGTWKIDAQGRVTQAQIATLAPVSYAYNSRGLLSTITAGSGAASRATSLVYNGAYNLTGISDASGRTTNFAYEPAGRPITETLPDSSVIGYAYDGNGNLTGLTPPGRPQHRFAYTAIDQIAQYTPPDVNPGSDQTQYGYNADRRFTLSTRPDGQTTSIGYDAAGRMNAVAIGRGQFGYTYDPTTGKFAALSAPGGITLTYAYDGGLLTGKNWAGPIAGNVAYVYDSRFRLTSTRVNSGSTVSFQYDNDSLLTQAGALVLSRSAQNGLLTGSALGNVTDTWSYSGFAEPINYSAVYNAAPLYNIQYDRDKLGRITQKSETIGGVTAVYSYTYDLTGRLVGAQKNGLAVESYTYDANGNRLSASSTGGTRTGVYDAQDRLTQYGVTAYTYTAAGELVTKTTGAQTTVYPSRRDSHHLSGGRRDPAHRQTGKRRVGAGISLRERPAADCRTGRQRGSGESIRLRHPRQRARLSGQRRGNLPYSDRPSGQPAAGGGCCHRDHRPAHELRQLRQCAD